MKIQINADDKITEDEFKYIYCNLQHIIEKYVASYEYKKQKEFVKEYSWQKPRAWEYELDGWSIIGRISKPLLIKGVNNTLYFKFKQKEK